MPARYDVFLSYATADRPLVEELARRLAREGLKPWLDRWHLIPGKLWLPEVEKVLPDCNACAVLIGPGGVGAWQDEEMWRAISLRVEKREDGFQVIPVLLPGAERPERSKLPGFLTATTWVEFRDTVDDPEAFHRLVCGIRGVEPEEGPGKGAFEGMNPYRGLELFDVEHAPLFFGREALTEWLLDALKRKHSGTENRFLAIVGASGSGKSSLARAGLMADLKDGRLDGSAAWPRAICRPGTEPLLSLANALKSVAHESDRVLVFDRLHGRKDGERSLHVGAALALGEPPRAERLVVLVDQFEEVFTLCNNEPERREFIANLLHAATVAGGRTIVVLTMRADFYPRCAAYADLASALSDHQVLVGPMTEEELRRAIERPARLAGLETEPGLAELLVDDIRDRPGALPLLEFALQEVWRRRDDHRLTIRTYREIGRIEGALQRKADAVYAGFTPEQQELCRRVFLRLVQPGEGSEDTRRHASLRELLPDDPDQAAAVRAIIDRLTDPESRLLTTERQQTASGEGTLEVAHEALIRGWPQLRKWIETDRAGLRTHLRLTDAAREWADAAAEAREATLYTGARLAVASEWAELHRDELGALESAFLSASQEHERQEKADEAEKNRRLAEAERQRAEEAEARKLDAEAAARHQTKLSRWLMFAAATSLFLTIAAVWESRRANEASGKANTAAKEAEKSEKRAKEKEKLAITAAEAAKKSEAHAKVQTRIATSRQLAALSASARDKRLDRSLLLAVEAVRAGNTVEARASLYDALQDRPAIRSFLHAQKGSVNGVAFSPDGKILAAGCQKRVELWDAAARSRLVDSLPVREGVVTAVAFSPDGKILAAGYVNSDGGGVLLWDFAVRARRLGGDLRVSPGRVRGVAFSPDGKILAAASEFTDSGISRGGVVLWDVASGAQRAEYKSSSEIGGFEGVAFSPDGKILAAGCGGSLLLWGVATGQRLDEDKLFVAERLITNVAFSPDGKTLAAGCSSVIPGSGSGVALWNVAKREPPIGEVLPVAGAVQVQCVAFSRDGETLAAGYFGEDRGGVVLWKTSTRRRHPATALPEGAVAGVAFSPDGEALAVGYSRDVDGFDGGVVLCDVATRTRLVRGDLPVEEGEIQAVAFSPDGKILAAGYDVYNSVKGGVELWDTSTRRRLNKSSFSVEDVRTVSFSPDGKTLAAGVGGRDVDDAVVLWDVGSRQRLDKGELGVPEGYVGRLSFSPDGKTLAAGSPKGVLLWDAATRRRPGGMLVAPATGDPEAAPAFSPDGRILAVVSREGVVLWEVATRQRLDEGRLLSALGSVAGVAFSPDGKTLAVGYYVTGVNGGGVGGVILWDTATRKLAADERLHVKEGRIKDLVFSADGTTLAAGYSGAGRAGVVLWDAVTLGRLGSKPLDVTEGDVRSMAFSPHDNVIATANGKYGVSLIDVDLRSWERHAGRIANRNFTRDEWRHYFPEEPHYRPTFPELPVPPEVPSQEEEIHR